MRRVLFCAILLASVGALAKDPPAQVLTWPSNGPPVLRLSFGRFNGIATVQGRRTYTSNVVAENLWGKPIKHIEFDVYLADKNNTRIGDGYIQLSNIGVGESVKFEFNTSTIGQPVSIALLAKNLPVELQAYGELRKVTLTVTSVPQGAGLSVDGVEAGTTPKTVELAVGKHMLAFSKSGFNTGHFPLEVGPNDVSGGSVSYELGTSAHDTVELRDGSVLTCDVESVSATSVEVRMGGQSQTLDRNKVKRIQLVERDNTPR
jgi:hypothetical protein